MAQPAKKTSCLGKQRIVALAVDYSECSEDAFDYYCDVISKAGDKLVMIHVPEETSFMAGPEEKVKQMKAQAAKMDTLERKYNDALVLRRIEGKFRVGMGKPGPVIVRVTQEEDADLLIVGTRGQSNVRQMLMGSVSKHVLCNSPVPVLVFNKNQRLGPRDDQPMQESSGSALDLRGFDGFNLSLTEAKASSTPHPAPAPAPASAAGGKKAKK